jgi:hypothetical protein
VRYCRRQSWRKRRAAYQESYEYLQKGEVSLKMRSIEKRKYEMRGRPTAKFPQSKLRNL